MDRYDHFIEARGPLVCFILFLIPGFPKAALCYIIGLSQMNVWIFIAISTVGRLFGTILLSLTGDSVRTMRFASPFHNFGTCRYFLFICLFLSRQITGDDEKT